jgi:hypothetical protein
MTMPHFLTEAMKVAETIWNGLPGRQDHLPVLAVVTPDDEQVIGVLDVPDDKVTDAAVNVARQTKAVKSALIRGVWFTTPDDYPNGLRPFVGVSIRRAVRP